MLCQHRAEESCPWGDACEEPSAEWCSPAVPHSQAPQAGTLLASLHPCAIVAAQGGEQSTPTFAAGGTRPGAGDGATKQVPGDLVLRSAE